MHIFINNVDEWICKIFLSTLQTQWLNENFVKCACVAKYLSKLLPLLQRLCDDFLMLISIISDNASDTVGTIDNNLPAMHWVWQATPWILGREWQFSHLVPHTVRRPFHSNDALQQNNIPFGYQRQQFQLRSNSQCRKRKSKKPLTNALRQATNCAKKLCVHFALNSLLIIHPLARFVEFNAIECLTVEKILKYKIRLTRHTTLQAITDLSLQSADEFYSIDALFCCLFVLFFSWRVFCLLSSQS